MSERLLKMVSELYAGLRSLEDAVREEPEPTPVEQPDRFEHTDSDGDTLTFRDNGDERIYVQVNDRAGVLLSPDVVNRLAQYLDGRRTDTADVAADRVEIPAVACPGRYRRPLDEDEQCEKVYHHVGVHSSNSGMHRWSDDASNAYLAGDRPETVPASAEQPREHWCGSDSDHAEHVHGRNERMRCLGAYRGHYGVTKDMT